jgi:hypothetical protein
VFKLVVVVDGVEIEAKTDQSQKSICCTSFAKTSSGFYPYHRKDNQVDDWYKKHKHPPQGAIDDFH